MTTNRNISRSQIYALRDEAAAHGDDAMVATCDHALADLRAAPYQRETSAVRTCADVIADAEALS